MSQNGQWTLHDFGILRDPITVTLLILDFLIWQKMVVRSFAQRILNFRNLDFGPGMFFMSTLCQYINLFRIHRADVRVLLSWWAFRACSSGELYFLDLPGIHWFLLILEESSEIYWFWRDSVELFKIYWF